MREIINKYCNFSDFKNILANQKLFTCSNEYKFFNLYNALIASIENMAYIGKGLNIIEVGVYKGGTANFISNVLQDFKIDNPNVNFLMFDTFEGIPFSNPEKGDGHKIGDFADVDFTELQSFFAQYPFTQIYKGKFEDCFRILDDKPIHFCHVDVDVYDSYKFALNYLYPKLVQGGFMVFDDYSSPGCEGAQKAVDEYFSSQSGFTLFDFKHLGQAILQKKES